MTARPRRLLAGTAQPGNSKVKEYIGSGQLAGAVVMVEQGREVPYDKHQRLAMLGTWRSMRSAVVCGT